MESVGAIVVGAGVVGLAVARELALAGHETVILEAADAIGTHTSSRNSEVIHAGIYYPKGSLKARACVAGKELLYEYCVAHGVPHRRSGKLIVATDSSQLEELNQIRKKAHANGVTDVVWMEKAQALALEPALNCVAALYSPSTGIIDSHALMLAYLGDAEDRGAMLALKTELIGAQVVADGFVLHTNETDVRCRILVNSAGLARHAPALETTPADYDTVMEVNLRAAYFLTREVARGLVAAGKPGSLINISSQMGHVGGPDRAVYAASKHALEGMTKAMAIEWGPHGIRVNTLCPTFIRTPLAEQTLRDPARRAGDEGEVRSR